VRVFASNHFKDWIEGHGLEVASSKVDIQAVMESEGGHEWIEHGNNPVVQMRVMRKLLHRVGWAMMADAWDACHDAEVVVSSFTSDVFAVSIAEKLGAKHVSALLQPALVATRSGAATMNAPAPNRDSIINYWFGKWLLEPTLWRLNGDGANRFRQELLGLRPQTYAQNRAAMRRMLVVHGYSRHVVPHPPDWPANLYTTGYWFLDDARDWQPPADLLHFLEAGEPPVCIGFGSMTGRDPQAMTRLVVDAAVQSGRRAVLLSGWAGIGDANLPPSIFCLDAAPHDWLFPRMAAVVHHGGAGTTAAGLRAGVPSVIVPHLGDQPFWGQRVEALGVGPRAIPRPKLTSTALSEAIVVATSDVAMRRRTADLSARIAAEDGIGTAVGLIEQFLRAAG
jgi:UDP:flavonoid glycosyltransferase YjiC (YdhE family)